MPPDESRRRIRPISLTYWRLANHGSPGLEAPRQKAGRHGSRFPTVDDVKHDGVRLAPMGVRRHHRKDRIRRVTMRRPVGGLDEHVGPVHAQTACKAQSLHHDVRRQRYDKGGAGCIVGEPIVVEGSVHSGFRPGSQFPV
jgi:hypothetical protein